MDERDVVGLAEQPHHFLGLVQAHQPVIDEDAGELLADRLVDEHGGDGGIDAARQPADHPVEATCFLILWIISVLKWRHRPVALAAADLEREIAQKPRAVRRVHHFHVELRGVELAAPHRRSRRRARPRSSR